MSSTTRTIQHGIGRLTATGSGGGTFLTQVAHKSPTRLVPQRASAVQRAGAALCAVSSYGGGILHGDRSTVHIEVKANATLGVTTQGVNRVYRRRDRRLQQGDESSYATRDDETHTHADSDIACTTLNASVSEDALLVYAPDPCAMFATSALEQNQTISLHPTASLVSIDWFSSGRYKNGERWNFDYLSTKTRIMGWSQDEDKDASHEKLTSSNPLIQDAVRMDRRGLRTGNIDEYSSDPFGLSGINSFASVILYGHQTNDVANKCFRLQELLMSRHTSVRERRGAANRNESMQASAQSCIEKLSGRVHMGVSSISLDGPPNEYLERDISGPQSSERGLTAHVVRLAATTNEDLYRVFHHCLLPLAPSFGGLSFYKDRIRASASELAQVPGTATAKQSALDAYMVDMNRSAKVESSSVEQTIAPIGASEGKAEVHNQYHSVANALPSKRGADWAAYMLADSCMPTGSFAHSAGLEVAAQLGIVDESNLESFIVTATRSALQTTAPFVLAARKWITNVDTNSTPTEQLLHQWDELQQQAHAAVVSNAPACAASLDQGKSLMRVSRDWIADRKNDTMSVDENDGPKGTSHKMRNLFRVLHLSSFTKNHLGPNLGLVTKCLGIEEDATAIRILGYCIARDFVSASIRLSLVGPVASVRLLSRIHPSMDGAITNAKNPLDYSSSCAPVLEALHPCHDILQVRLFRT